MSKNIDPWDYEAMVAAGNVVVLTDSNKRGGKTAVSWQRKATAEKILFWGHEQGTLTGENKREHESTFQRSRKPTDEELAEIRRICKEEKRFPAFIDYTDIRNREENKVLMQLAKEREEKFDLERRLAELQEQMNAGKSPMVDTVNEPSAESVKAKPGPKPKNQEGGEA